MIQSKSQLELAQFPVAALGALRGLPNPCAHAQGRGHSEVPNPLSMLALCVILWLHFSMVVGYEQELKSIKSL